MNVNVLVAARFTALVVALPLLVCGCARSSEEQIAKLQSALSQMDLRVAAAEQAASGAQSTANQALAASQASQSAVDATNERIDRMDRRHISK